MSREDGTTPISIGLTVWDGGLGVSYLTRHMTLDDDGRLLDERYRTNTTVDFDEETIRLLEDTMRGMQAELNRLKKNKKEDA